MAIKVAMIGAGLIGFTRRLVQDILIVPKLAGTEFAFNGDGSGGSWRCNPA